MPRYVYALDLEDNPEAIREYEEWHRADRVWPEIVESLRTCGLDSLEIFRTGNRLVLIIDAPAAFSPAEKAARDAADPVVQKWEALMWKFQRALPWAAPGQKWVPMEVIYSLIGGVIKSG